MTQLLSDLFRVVLSFANDLDTFVFGIIFSFGNPLFLLFVVGGLALFVGIVSGISWAFGLVLSKLLRYDESQARVDIGIGDMGGVLGFAVATDSFGRMRIGQFGIFHSHVLDFIVTNPVYLTIIGACVSVLVWRVFYVIARFVRGYSRAP